MLLIRADAGPMIGHGHVMRMIAVAQGWQKFGGTVVFAGIECPDTLIDRVEKEGWRWQFLNVSEIGDDLDAVKFAELAIVLKCTAVLLDGYKFTENYLRILKSHLSQPIATMVDSVPSDVFFRLLDLVFYPCLSQPSETGFYSGKLRAGPEYVPIREEFHSAARKKKAMELPVVGDLRLFLCLGGSDPQNATSRVINALQSVSYRFLSKLSLRVAIGASNKYLTEIKYSCSRLQREIPCELLFDVNDMAEQFLWADAVITSASGMVWEWMLVGLPGAVIAIAENQRGFYEQLVLNDYCFGLGNLLDASNTRLKREIEGWVRKLMLNRGSVERGDFGKCSRDGSIKVCEAIMGIR